MMLSEMTNLLRTGNLAKSVIRWVIPQRFSIVQNSRERHCPFNNGPRGLGTRGRRSALMIFNVQQQPITARLEPRHGSAQKAQGEKGQAPSSPPTVYISPGHAVSALILLLKIVWDRRSSTSDFFIGLHCLILL